MCTWNATLVKQPFKLHKVSTCVGAGGARLEWLESKSWTSKTWRC